MGGIKKKRGENSTVHKNILRRGTKTLPSSSAAKEQQEEEDGSSKQCGKNINHTPLNVVHLLRADSSTTTSESGALDERRSLRGRPCWPLRGHESTSRLRGFVEGTGIISDSLVNEILLQQMVHEGKIRAHMSHG